VCATIRTVSIGPGRGSPFFVHSPRSVLIPFPLFSVALSGMISCQIWAHSRWRKSQTVNVYGPILVVHLPFYPLSSPSRLLTTESETS